MADIKLPKIERDKLMEKEAPLEAYSELGKNHLTDLSPVFEENKSFLNMATDKVNQVLRVYSPKEGDDKLKSNSRESFIKNKQAELSAKQPIMPPLPAEKAPSGLTSKVGFFSADKRKVPDSQVEPKKTPKPPGSSS